MENRIRDRLNSLWLLSLLLCQNQYSVQASQCIYQERLPKEMTVIFAGKMFAVEELPPENIHFSFDGKNYQIIQRRYARYTFLVTTQWKGPQQPTYSVITEMRYGLCRLDFQPGQDYLVFALGPLDSLETGIACGTVSFNDFEAAGKIAYLNQAIKTMEDTLPVAFQVLPAMRFLRIVVFGSILAIGLLALIKIRSLRHLRMGGTAKWLYKNRKHNNR